jgi:hypothetical protein
VVVKFVPWELGLYPIGELCIGYRCGDGWGSSCIVAGSLRGVLASIRGGSSG